MPGAGALLVIGGAAGLVAGFWLGARRRRSMALAAVPAAPPPAPRPPRPTLNPVVVLRGDDIAALDERDALQELEDRKRSRERNARLAGKLARGATGGRGAQEFPDFHRLGVAECVEKSRR